MKHITLPPWNPLWLLVRAVRSSFRLARDLTFPLCNPSTLHPGSILCCLCCFFKLYCIFAVYIAFLDLLLYIKSHCWYFQLYWAQCHRKQQAFHCTMEGYVGYVTDKFETEQHRLVGLYRVLGTILCQAKTRVRVNGHFSKWLKTSKFKNSWCATQQCKPTVLL